MPSLKDRLGRRWDEGGMYYVDSNPRRRRLEKMEWASHRDRDYAHRRNPHAEGNRSKEEELAFERFISYYSFHKLELLEECWVAGAGDPYAADEHVKEMFKKPVTPPPRESRRESPHSSSSTSASAAGSSQKDSAASSSSKEPRFVNNAALELVLQTDDESMATDEPRDAGDSTAEHDQQSKRGATPEPVDRPELPARPSKRQKTVHFTLEQQSSRKDEEDAVFSSASSSENKYSFDWKIEIPRIRRAKYGYDARRYAREHYKKDVVDDRERRAVMGGVEVLLQTQVNEILAQLEKVRAYNAEWDMLVLSEN